MRKNLDGTAGVFGRQFAILRGLSVQITPENAMCVRISPVNRERERRQSEGAHKGVAREGAGSGTCYRGRMNRLEAPSKTARIDYLPGLQYSMEPAIGLEPMTPALRERCSTN